MQQAAWQKYVPLSGILFIVLFIIGVTLGTGYAENDDTDQELLDWYADSGNRQAALVGVYLLALSAVSFLLFMNRLRAIVAEAEGGHALFAPFILAGGTVFAVSICAAGAAFGAIPGEIEFGETAELTNADLGRFLPSLGFGFMLVLGMFPLIFAMFTTAVASMRHEIFPAWFNWLTLICGIVLFFAAFFIPLIALGIWLIVASILLMKKQPGMATA